MARPKEFDESLALQQAMDTFWERGYDATAVRDLCDAMGLNAGSLYGAFGDKRALFLRALDNYIETESRQAAERITGAASGLLGIRAFFDHMIEQMHKGRRRWGCLVTNSIAELACSDPDVAARAKLQLKRLEGNFASALDRSRSAGEISPSIGAETAAFLVCVVQGLNILAKTRPGRAALHRVVDVALANLESRAAPLEAIAS